MASIFITGSADGLGQLAARTLADAGHEVVLHARSEQRAQQARQQVPHAADVIVGDLSDLDETKGVAEAANAWGRFDAVIHNAGVYPASARDTLAVNVVAPYVLTAAMHRPARLIYLSSGMHQSGRADLRALTGDPVRLSYSDSKLLVVLLCKAAARAWPDVYANAVDPGWVPTKMGGQGATDDLNEGYRTQTWLATSDDPAARVSGRYFFHRQEQRPHPQADDTALQDDLLRVCGEITGVTFPR